MTEAASLAQSNSEMVNAASDVTAKEKEREMQ